ncbi:hypothetical protein J5X84_07965 [Streptosporangiaceae bacterium NEAU-GS5]|nr:hypothetical protein [Streptosporangiaceae bacterium NEAU-GS5]
MRAVIYRERDAVDRLAGMGLSVEDFHAAAKGGDGEARTWTEAAPAAMRGMARWGRTNEILRIRKSRDGWGHRDHHGLPLTIHPSGRIAIVATTGDALTGQAIGGHPSTKYAKGMTYQRAVEENEQLALFDLEDFGVRLPPDISERWQTWILLYHVTSEGVFLELSLPRSIAPNGHVDSWHERILIPAYEIDGTPIGDERSVEAGRAVHVAVERR